jgi:hypothetical protein
VMKMEFRKINTKYGKVCKCIEGFVNLWWFCRIFFNWDAEKHSFPI